MPKNRTRFGVRLPAASTRGRPAARRIVVKDLPAFVVCDDKGGNLYSL